MTLDVDVEQDVNRRRLAQAYKIALNSPDPSTHNGAIITDRAGTLILGRGCNQFPRGVEYYPERWERPLKYEIIEHAERNAIFDAAYHGRRCKGATMYAAWAACSDCARAIIQAGIIKLVRHADATKRATMPGKDWTDTISTADMMLREAGVEIVDIEGKVTDGLALLHSGKPWSP